MAVLHGYIIIASNSHKGAGHLTTCVEDLLSLFLGVFYN